MHHMRSRILLFCVGLNLVLAGPSEGADGRREFGRLRPDFSRSGGEMLRAFNPIALSNRLSVVQLTVAGKAVALGTMMDTNGLALTKASEFSPGDLIQARLADGREVSAKLLVSDEDSDLGLVKIDADGLVPVGWAPGEVTVGQWAVTPGIRSNPEAIGIVSVPARRILPKRALIGVRLDFGATGGARIAGLMPGMGAEAAGLQAGDTILTVNNAVIAGAEDLMTVLGSYREGQTVNLRVRRGTEEFTASIPMKPERVETRGRGSERQERMNRMGGALSRRAEDFQLAIQHDTVLLPWQCGGPVTDLEGRAMGLNIARAGRVASYALPAPLVRQVFQELRKEADAQLNPPESVRSSTGDS
jgi:serine protease Do